VDGVDEHVLADLQVGGQTRKVMIQSNKNGFMYVVDRTKLQADRRASYTKVNWAAGIDLATGRPQLTGVYKDFLAGDEVQIYPSRGSNAVPIAFNPNKGLVYAAPWDLPRIQKLAPPKQQEIGKDSTGVNARQPQDQSRRRRRLLHCVRSAHRTEEMGGALDRHGKLGGHAGHRGGLCSRAKPTANSSRSTRTPARRSGSSRPVRASTQRPSPTPTRAGNMCRSPRVMGGILARRAVGWQSADRRLAVAFATDAGMKAGCRANMKPCKSSPSALVLDGPER